LTESLDDIIAEIDYSHVISKHGRYRRNGGKKSLELERRMLDYKIQLLRNKVLKDALGTPGMTPNHLTVKLVDIQSDVDIFWAFLSEIKKENGGLLKPGGYCSFRPSFMYLFHRYQHDVSRQFEKDLKMAMEDVKRYTNLAIQAGEGDIWQQSFALGAL
jgi:hypothetical protein